MRTSVSAPTTSLFLVALASLGACEIGQTNSSDGDTDSDDTDNDGNTDSDDGLEPDAAPVASISATATPPAQTTELLTSGAAAAGDQETRNAKNRFEMEVESVAGFTGEVTFSVTGLGTGWTATFDPASVTLADGASATTTLRVEIASTGEAAAKTLTLVASSDAGDVMKAVTMTAEPFVTVSDTVVSDGAAMVAPVTINAGTEFRIRNDSAQLHQIHGPGNTRASTDPANYDADNGDFPHQNQTGGTGTTEDAFYIVMPDPGTYSWYGHNFGDGAGLPESLIVQ